MIVLYDFPECPYAQKVRIVLVEKDLEFETKLVDLRKNEQRSAEFLKLNPLGKVPVLVDDEAKIYDSTIINEYLDEEYPNPPLMPEDSYGRALVRMSEDLADMLFTPRIELLQTELRRADGERDAEKVRRLQTEVVQLLRRLDATLGRHRFVAGEFSLADVAFAPGLLLLPKLGIEIDSSLANVQRWAKELQERHSIRSLQV
ncbi:MAG: glutathione S-transferase family protein [Candidatus Binatia bacterium]|nr:glutathione S-transferase family protein [Candidatus Binatia bacterium]